MVDPFNSKKTIYVVLTAILLVAVGLRVHKIDAFGLGGDEKYALLVSQFISQEGGGQSNVFRTEGKKYFTNTELQQPRSFYDFQMAIAHRDNGSGATYDLLLNAWTKVFGVSDAAVRSMSLTVNILTILLLFVFVREFFNDEKVALAAAFFAAVSPFYIVYSQVARGYALLFFWALLLSYLLLLYLKKPQVVYLVVYSIITFLALQTHYSIFVLFFFHGLYLLFFYRTWKVLIAYTLTMVFPFVGMVAWLNMPGGAWALHSVKVSAEVYSKMAVDSPSEWLQISSVRTVASQLWKVFTYTVPFLHNLGDELSGVKNMVLSGLGGVFIAFLCVYQRAAVWLRAGVATLLLVLVYLFTTVSNLQFVYWTLVVSLIIFILLKNNNYRNKFVLFCGLIYLLSLFFLGVFAFQDGNTMRIIPRYSGYGYAFACALTAIGSSFIAKQRGLPRYFLLATLLLCGVNYFQIMQRVYRDEPPNYFHHFSEIRLPNPYETIARQVAATYVEGDTLIHPSYTPDNGYGGFNTPDFSVQDAQYLNIYLPKAPPVIWQRIDRNEPDKVFLKHKDGSKDLLFNFQKEKYRY